MLQNDEAALLYLADAAVADKSNRYKHTSADIPDSWVLIYRASCQKSRGCPHQPQRGCVVYRLHILFYA